MKKIAPLSVLSSALLLTCLGGIKLNSFKEAKAYDKATLPTTIDLNAVADADIRSYYSNIDGLSDAEARGTNLLKNLKPILMNGQKYYSYDVSSGKDIWKMYEITDRDWVKSPASEISGYNATTNIITGYTYGESASKSGSNPYIHALYVNRDADNNVRAWAKTGTTTSHGGNNEWCIDREHIWPKSHGFEDNDSDPATSGARGDPMHLWAGDSYVNSALHSNYFYGYVDKTKAYTDGKDKYAYASGNLMGFSKTKGGGNSVFEPQDSDKGDIARAVFYMVARYNYLSGSDATGIENDNPNLELVDNATDWVKSGYISTTTKTGKLGILSDLLEWNKLDPVDDYEIKRNDILYRNYTNNRNPFIDFPQWADVIWGENKDTGRANPASDSINNDGDTPTPTPSPVDSVTIDKVTISEATDEVQSVTLSNLNGAVVEYTVTSGSDVISVEKVEQDGNIVLRVTGLKEGNAILTIKVTNGDDSKTFNVGITINKKADTNPIAGLDLKMILIIGGVALVVLIIVIILFAKFGSKKAKKKAAKYAKKVVKSSSNNRKK